MHFRLLGPTEVHDGRGWSLPIAPRERTLLTMLLLDAGQVVSRARLVEAVWESGPPPTARGQIHACVCRLRRLLRATPSAEIGTLGSGYRISVDLDTVDVLRFRRLVTEAHLATDEGRWSDAIRCFRSAERLWRGPALDGVRTGLLGGVAAALEEKRITALEDCLDLELRHRPNGHLVADLTGLVLEHPFRERLHGMLMCALYQAGRKAEALAVYERARVRLAEEVGLNPGRNLRELHRAILRDELLVPVGSG